ncbi:NTP transferase domain-containing protein [Ulvibacterium sp.]|uniref:NTP transferase domain-containing protein n=1 Tax=Ulvibacterium sp. TaxID=2665914 RepID=UPI003CC64961
MILKDNLYGLVLSGGKSTRMGKDKGQITYHGMPQREYLYHLLDGVCERTYMSIRREQEGEIKAEFKSIRDQDKYKGPFNGLLSAHSQFPDVAWLVLACDLPLMDEPSLRQLVLARNPSKMATAFAQEEDPLPEPLCAIWEPEALRSSITYLAQGNGTCPRKFLINNEVKLVFPTNPDVLLNANSEEEYKEALGKLETI